ncbi:MAG: NAD(P)/FAD-dependent oxidoreductase [Spirochaetia bacterium]
MMSYDVLILGCGPAGYYAALGCARAGFRTAVVEKGELGGTGFRWGCLPVKMMLDELRSRQGRNPRGAAHPSAASRLFGRRLLARTSAAMVGVERRMAQELERHGVQLIHGEGEFIDAHTIRAGGALFPASTIVIATGTGPWAPAGVILNGDTVASHADLVTWRAAPTTAVIVGADVEGIELACLLAHLGTQVELIEVKGEILPGMDRDLVKPVEERLRALGTRMRLSAEVVHVHSERGGAAVLLADGSTTRAGKVLVTGVRRPNFPAGLVGAGIVHTADRIGVDDRFRTSVHHIYAIGDINGLCGMAHAAIQQGILLARIIRGGQPGPAAWPSLPRALFTIPEIAGAGSQARDLEQQGIPYTRATFALADTWRGISRNFHEGFVTVLAAKDRKLLGLWVCGQGASELAAPFGPLLDRGAAVDDLLESLFIHPTLSEGLLEAAWRLAT